MSDRRSILLLCRTTKAEAGNVAEHVRALTTLSRHDVRSFDPVDRPDAARLLDLDEFDAVVIHYTIPVVVERYFPAVLREKVAAYQGLKVQFIQDEYRWVDAVTTTMRELGISLLFTCVSGAETPKVYGSVPGLEAITTLPGYVPDHLVGRPTPPLASRPIDVGYRGRSVPYWLGRLGWEKAAIGLEFRARCESHGLRCDIALDEAERIYGEDWHRFLASCRATLGTESGASIADFDGSVEAGVKSYLARRADATFEEVEEHVLTPFEGNVVINTISSRIFEAAALRTAMVLFPGEYSGAIAAGTHYLPLARDFSNMGEVAAALKDTAHLEHLTERAYEELVGSGRYSLRAFVAEFDAALAARSERRSDGHLRAYARARRRHALPPTRPPRLVFHLRNAAKPAVMAALVTRDAAVRRLVVALVRDRQTRRRAGLRRAAADAWKLAALRRGVRAGLFHVVPSVEDSGRRLVLTTRAGPGESLPVSDLPDEVIWDHALVSETVPLVGREGLPTAVGRRGAGSAHAFSAVAALGRGHRGVALDALSPVSRDAGERS